MAKSYLLNYSGSVSALGKNSVVYKTTSFYYSGNERPASNEHIVYSEITISGKHSHGLFSNSTSISLTLTNKNDQKKVIRIGSQYAIGTNHHFTRVIGIPGEFEKLEIGNSSGTFSVTSISAKYITVPYKLNLQILSEVDDTTKYTLTAKETNDEYSIELSCSTASGYKFVEWSDGNTSNPRIFNPGIVSPDAEFTLGAIFAPNQYFVNYYYIDINGNKHLFDTQECIVGNTYYYNNCPILDISVPNGYQYYNKGWIKFYNEEEYIYSIRNNNMYCTSVSNPSTSSHQSSTTVQSLESFKDLTYTDNYIVDLFCGVFPLQYQITYVSYTQGSQSNYKKTTEYRIYGYDFILNTLPTPSEGYKLTNQMTENNGPADVNNIKNSWFINQNLINPKDPTISTIQGSNLEENIEVYSYETPINYSIIFHAIDEFGNEINQETLNGIYGENYLRPSLLNEKDYNKIAGWYKTSQDTTLWYIDLETLEIVSSINSTPDYELMSYTGDKYTTIDQSIFHEYIYYIPYGYTIEYKWLDSWGSEEEFQFPITIKKYGLGDIEILDIPSYENNYIVENANTKNWYYYDENGELQINNKTFIGSTDPTNYTFYGRKEPLSRIIKITPNNYLYGKVKPISPAPEEWIQENNSFYTYVNEGDVVQVTAITDESNISYFSNWSDGITNASRDIIVGGLSKEYMADFRSNSIFINLMGVKAVYRNTELINPKIILGKQIN